MSADVLESGCKQWTKLSNARFASSQAGYQFCQPPPRYGHARVGAYLSVSLCLTGYPFRSITEKSWIFKPHNSDKVIPTLPDGATATLNNTDHPNMKMLILTIARVEDHHYGTYTLSIRNRFNRKNLVHSFSLSPGGTPPEFHIVVLLLSFSQ